MKKIIKKIISFICCVLIVANIFPAISFANENDFLDMTVQNENIIIEQSVLEDEKKHEEEISSGEDNNNLKEKETIAANVENEVVATVPGDVPTKNIYVFYDKPIANITNTGEGAIITKEDYFSGTSALKVKGDNWTGSSDAKIVFENSYDISSYLTNAKLSVKIKMPSNAVPSSGTNALQIDLYDINDVRRGYFINVTSADEWGEYTVSLNSQSAGWDTFDWTNLKWINIASRPQKYSSWYWYIDEVKIDLGLGDFEFEISDIKNGTDSIVNNVVDASKELTFTFNSEIDEESLKNIKISANGNEVNFTSQYTDKVYTVTISNELLPYVEYKMDLSSVCDKLGIPLKESEREFLFYKEADFRCGDITLNGQESASSKVTRLTQNDKKPVLMVAKYDTNGQMCDLIADEFVSQLAPEDMLSVTLPTFLGEEYGYAFVVDDIKTMNLLCDPHLIGTKTQIVSDEPFKVSGVEKLGYKDIYGLITVLKPSVTFDNLAVAEYTSLKDYILNISPVKTDENGDFELKFIYSGTESSVGEENTYFYTKTTVDGNSSVNLMPYFTLATLNQYVSDLELIESETEFINKFNKSLEVFEFDKKYYDLLSNKDETAKILFNTGFDDKESLLKAFLSSSAVAALNQKTDIEFTDLVSYLKEDISKEITMYNNLSDNGKINVKTNMIGKGFSNLTDAYDKYFEQLIINTITNYKSEGYSQVEETILQSKIDLSVYNRANNKDYIEKMLVSYPLTDLLSIETAISNYATFPTPSSGGGGRGSSKKASLSGASVVTYATDREGYVSEGKSEDVQNKGFSDLDSVIWAKDAINYLAEKQIAKGVEKGKFAPWLPVTREEFVAFLARSYNLTSAKKVSFTDVDETHWAYDYICAAKETGFVLGNEDGSFGVGEYITREDIAVMVYRISKLESVKEQEGFSDEDEISDYAKDAVLALKENGIMSGMGDNLFAPKAKTTRAQVAQVIYNLITRR